MSIPHTTTTPTAAPPGSNAQPPPPLRPGFTLIELLVTLGLLAALLALLLPALAGARNSGRRVGRLAQASQMGMAVESYAASYRELYPYILVEGDPDAPTPYYTPEFADFPPLYFRANATHYATALAADGHEIRDIRGTESPFFEGLWPTAFQLTHATAAIPDYWIPASPTPGDRPRHYRAQGRSALLYPSHKGLLTDEGWNRSDRFADRDPATLTRVMADGSASTQRAQPLDLDLTRPFGVIPFRVLLTPHGLRGTDR